MLEYAKKFQEDNPGLFPGLKHSKPQLIPDPNLVFGNPDGPGYLMDIYHAISTGIFRRLVSRLLSRLPRMLLNVANNPRMLANDAVDYVKTRTASLGLNTILFDILTAMVGQFVQKWYDENIRQQKEEQLFEMDISDEDLFEDVTMDVTDKDLFDDVNNKTNITGGQGVPEAGDLVVKQDIKQDKKLNETEILPELLENNKQDKPTQQTAITQDGIKVEPLVMTIAPDPKILQDTRKFEVYDPEDQENALLVGDNNPADDLVVSREALFSFRRDVLGTVHNNPLLALNAQRDNIRYSDMTLRPARGFTEGENDINQFDAIWIDTPGRVNEGLIAKFTPKPTVSSIMEIRRGEPAITLPRVAFIEPDFKTHETMFFGSNTGDRNDIAPFISPLKGFSDVTPLDVTRSKLFGQTERFV